MAKSNLLRRETARKIIPIMNQLMGMLHQNIELVQGEANEIPPEEISEEEWKKQKIKDASLKELEQNKKAYENNSKMLEMKLELEKANYDYLNTETKKCNFNRDLINIELKNSKVLNPTMAYQNTEEWQAKWKELKLMELDDIETNLKTINKNFENQKNKIDSIDEVKIKNDQKKLEERKLQLEEDLRSIGVDLKEEKIEYTG